MDALSGVASVVSILQLAGTVVEHSFELFQQFKDAPAELEAARNCLVLVRAELLALANLDAIGTEHSFSLDTVNGLNAALQTARDALRDAETDLQQLPTKIRFKGRVRWALLDQRRSERVCRHVKSVESSLTTVLLLLRIRTQDAKFAAMKSSLDACLANAAIKAPQLQSIINTTPIRRHNRARVAQSSLKTTWVRTFINSAVFGLRLAMVRVGWADSDDWFFSIRQRLPFANFIGAALVLIRLNLSTNSICRSLSFRNGSGFALVRLVEQDAPLIEACKNGHVEAARRILGARQGFITDTTAEPAWTPLAYSIRCGSLELVKLLLSCGAGIDWTVGNNQTSPLQLALWFGETEIARYLLRSGADVDYRSLLGFDLPYFAWSAKRGAKILELNLKMMYSENGLSQLDDLDLYGWTCLHHIAAFGSSEEAEVFLRAGADPLVLSEPLGWNALQVAIYYDNWEVYSCLKHHCGPSMLSFVDTRGWTLLHLAAASGTRTLIQDLLQEGADVNALTIPTTEYVDPALFMKRCSPLDVAICSKLETDFLEAVESYYGSRNLVVGRGDDHDIELYHDANE